MTEPTLGAAPERPLVTFALFAYNQEKYIREAVEGAFSQTYEPLEIILSDDCSSDRTFEIMQEMAAEYQGRHRVVARRNDTNVGIIDHMLNVAAEASGALMVVAAGDDISFPHRCQRLAEAWMFTRPVAVYSGCSEIDDDGRVVSKEVFPEPLQRVQELFEGCKTPKRYGGFVRNIPGYSAAYDLEFLEKLPKTGRGIHNEDALTTYYSNLIGGDIVYVREILVNRRLSLTSISAVSTYRNLAQIRRNEYIVQSFSKSTLGFLEYFSELRNLFKSNDYKIVMSRLLNDRSYYYAVANFWDMSFFGRLNMIFKVRDYKAFRYVLPRVFGMRIFCMARIFIQRVHMGI